MLDNFCQLDNLVREEEALHVNLPGNMTDGSFLSQTQIARAVKGDETACTQGFTAIRRACIPSVRGGEEFFGEIAGLDLF